MKKLLTLVSFIAVLFCQSARAQITGDTSVCAGETVTYYAPYVNGASYFWNVTGGNLLGSPATDSAVVQWGNAGAGTIIVSQTNPTAVYFLNVTIHPNPNPVITHAPYPTCPTDTGTGQSGSVQDHKPACEKVCKFATITYSTALNAGSTYQWLATGALSVTPSANTATVTWDSTGYGTLLVIETNQWGCVDSAEICVEKVDLPVAGFTHQSSACKFSSVAFTNLSSGATSFQWYFGDGGSSTLTHPTHSYSNAGTYTITLIAFNACFCSDTFTSIISIDSLPGPDITCPSIVCAYDTATYSTTPGTGCIYNWFAIGGTIVSGQGTPNVTVAWGAGQVGTLGLYITGCNTACTDTTFITIPIVPSIATISGDTVVCPGDCKKYTLPLFSGATYTWSLGNSNCGVLSDSVCCNEVEICWASNLFGCNDTLTVQYYDSFLQCGGSASIIIRVRPELNIMGPNPTCSKGISSYFSSLGNACFWNVYPAGPVYAPGPSNSVSINWNGFTGNFLITAIPLNPNSTCSDSALFPVKVVGSPAAPVITGDTIICPGASVSYCANPTSNITNWVISGGTPSASIGSCVTVTWNNTGPYIVQAFNQMPNSPFCISDTTTQNVYTAPLTPPTILASSPFCANSTNTFSCPTPYPSGTTYNWSITPSNAGSVLSPGNATTQIEWGNNAPQNVTVSVSVNVCGNNLSNSTTVTLNAAPTPTVSQIGSLCAGGSAQLQATGGVSYSWSGPGGYTSVANPTTIFVDGLYQVTATNVNGCTALSQINVQYVSGPTASISTLSYLTYCIGTTYTVNICALGNANYAYLWSNAATSQCVSVTTPGAYSVVVTDLTNNCTALSNVLVVQEDSCNGGGGGGPGNCTPNGSVSFNHTSCNPVSFTNTSVNAFNFSWNFGDFTTSNLTNPTHSYPQAGFYLVTLSGLVPSVNGTDTCLVTDTAHIEIPLLAKFDVATGCWNDSVCFTDKSTFTAGNNITSWNWNFGDATTSTQTNPCHLYASPGTYIVTLTVSNGLCSDVVTDTVVVPAQPTAAFTFASPNCINNPVLFTDASFTSINYWNWNFGDAGTSLNQNPTHSFNPANTYTVTLIVHDIYGCYDTTQQNITIVAPALSGSITAFPDTIVCAGTNVLLVAPTCGTCTYLWSNGSTNDSIVVTATGIYSVTLNDGSGCPYSTFIKIIVNTGPPAVITNSGDDELCFGEFTNLSVPFSNNWLYQWISNDPNVNGATLNGVSVFGLPPGTYNYQVVITDTTTGCSDTSLPYIITVHPLPVPPVIVAVGSSTVCAGDTIMLVVSHPDPTIIFEWNTGEVNDTILVTKNGCYYATAIDTNGCENTASYCVTVNPLPYLCSYYEGCFDTCAPYTICAPAGSSWQWLNNGVPIPSATTQCYTTSMSGVYSVIVTNSFGCVDTTGELDLTLYPCPDSLCADFWIDSVACDSNGKYVLYYHVANQSQIPVTQVNLEILQPNLNIAYSPVVTFTTIPSQATSSQLSATIYNGSPGDSLCFRVHITAYDSMGMEELCCYSDTDCVVLPPCHKDTLCCFFNYLEDTVRCIPTPNGVNYYFQITVNGCGSLQMQASNNTVINGSNPLVMNGSPTTITGTYFPANAADTIMCITFMMSSNNIFCADTTICFHFSCDSPLGPPICDLNFQDSICVGQTTTFSYGGNTTGLTFTWQFPNGSPSTASGPGPHNVTYNTVGCHQVFLIINTPNNTIDCIDTICVLPPPVATIQQVGNSLFAYPGSYSYQWYSMNPNWTIMNGETNQFLNPQFSTLFCVVVSNGPGCSDTACIDHQSVGIDELAATDWRVYPNPNEGAFALSFNAATEQTIELKVMDMVGNTVDLRLFETHSGENNFYIANRNFAAGVYTIQLKTEKGVGLKRIVVK